MCEESVKPALLNAWLNIARAEAVSIVDPDFDETTRRVDAKSPANAWARYWGSVESKMKRSFLKL
jgi:hypothetical protein